jgi:hypothetical protein
MSCQGLPWNPPQQTAFGAQRRPHPGSGLSGSQWTPHHSIVLYLHLWCSLWFLLFKNVLLWVGSKGGGKGLGDDK